MSFRREKYMPKGGPDGGDGGKGGDIILQVNPNLNTLYHLKGKRIFTAKTGGHGMGNDMHGRNGEDVLIEVPEGTLVYDEIKGALIADVSAETPRIVICNGGRGGYGNAHFASSTRKTPRFAETGDISEVKELKLELKLIADIGIIGFPSVGKSTLIAAISNARPKIAAYDFTTLVPNLGVAYHKGETFVVSDIPGLIEGASDGKGLGFQFLKHIERCRLLLHVVDAGKLDDIIKNYDAIRNELDTYSSVLIELPEIIVLNKIDLLDEELLNMLTTSLEKHTGAPVMTISSATHMGLDTLQDHILERLQQLPKTQLVAEDDDETTPVLTPLEDDPKKWWLEEHENGKVVVRGSRIEQIVRMTELQNMEAMERIYDVMYKMGIDKALTKKDLLEGDLFYIGNIQIQYREKL